MNLNKHEQKGEKRIEHMYWAAMVGLWFVTIVVLIGILFGILIIFEIIT